MSRPADFGDRGKEASFQSSRHCPEPLGSRPEVHRHEMEPDADPCARHRHHSAARPDGRKPPSRAALTTSASPATSAKSSDLGVCGTNSSESSSPAFLRQGSGNRNTRHSLIKSITWRWHFRVGPCRFFPPGSLFTPSLVYRMECRYARKKGGRLCRPP